MNEFSLRALVREVAAESSSADPGALAEEVAGRVPDEDIRGAFLEMLRPFVRQALAADRSFSAPTTYHETGGQPERASRPGVRSWKRDGVRDHWAKVLQERVHVGIGSSDWKFLGDCDTDDLTFIAAERRHLAEANLAVAEKFEALAELLAEHGAETVRDLPREALTDHLGEAA